MHKNLLLMALGAIILASGILTWGLAIPKQAWPVQKDKTPIEPINHIQTQMEEETKGEPNDAPAKKPEHWLTYVDEQSGLSIDYPSDFKVCKSKYEAVSLSSINLGCFEFDNRSDKVKALLTTYSRAFICNTKHHCTDRYYLTYSGDKMVAPLVEERFLSIHNIKGYRNVRQDIGAKTTIVSYRYLTDDYLFLIECIIVSNDIIYIENVISFCDSIGQSVKSVR